MALWWRFVYLAVAGNHGHRSQGRPLSHVPDPGSWGIWVRFAIEILERRRTS